MIDGKFSMPPIIIRTEPCKICNIKLTLSIDENDLTIPHPFMHLRKFVLVPMVQLRPDLVHPTLGKTMTELLENLDEEGQVVSPLGDING